MCAQLSRDVVVVRVARFDQQLVLLVLDLEYGGTDQSPAVILHEHRPWKPALKQLALAWRQSWVIQHHPTILSSADAHTTIEAIVTDADIRAEAAIRQRVEECVNALRIKDIDGVMSLYADDLVGFDIVPPLQYVGAAAYRRRWLETFAAYTGPIEYEVRDLQITTHGELAFLRSLNHVQGTLASGQRTDLWLRWTACLRLIDGVWLVVHVHVSVPADLASGRAVLDLQPA